MSDYDRFEAQAKKMRDDLLALATAELDAWLEQTLSMMRRASRVAGPIVTASGVGAVATPAASAMKVGTPLARLARQAVESITTDTFTTLDIRKLVEPYYPTLGPTQRANLANVLKGLIKKECLELVRRGAGSRPSVYRKVEGAKI